jgi:hypothetical protein
MGCGSVAASVGRRARAWGIGARDAVHTPRSLRRFEAGAMRRRVRGSRRAGWQGALAIRRGSVAWMGREPLCARWGRRERCAAGHVAPGSIARAGVALGCVFGVSSWRGVLSVRCWELGRQRRVAVVGAGGLPAGERRRAGGCGVGAEGWHRWGDTVPSTAIHGDLALSATGLDTAVDMTPREKRTVARIHTARGGGGCLGPAWADRIDDGGVGGGASNTPPLRLTAVHCGLTAVEPRCSMPSAGLRLTAVSPFRGNAVSAPQSSMCPDRAHSTPTAVEPT